MESMTSDECVEAASFACASEGELDSSWPTISACLLDGGIHGICEEKVEGCVWYRALFAMVGN